MGKYCSLVSQGNSPLVAIPVFPSRVARHSSIYIRRDGAVREPSDLKGKRVGIPEWAQTASVYSRGFIQHQYGVDLASIQWVQAGVDQPGRAGEGQAQPAARHQLHGGTGQEPQRHAGVGRDRRSAVGASAVLLRARPSQRDADVRGLSRCRDEIRQGHRHLSDHAHDCAQARDRRAQSVGGGATCSRRSTRRGGAASSARSTAPVRPCRCRGATSSPGRCKTWSART